MPQPNDAEITRVYVRSTGGTVEDPTPNISGGSFDVVVENEAGRVLAGGGAPYQISIEALDLTAGNNPGAPFSASTPLGRIFNGLPDWPQNTQVFTITLNAAQVAAMTNHRLRYTASLLSPDPRNNLPPQVVSFTESKLFMLVRE